MSAVQNLHLVASGTIVSLQRGQVFVGAGGASLINALVIRYTMNAMITKSTTLPRNDPHLMAVFPIVIWAVRHSPLGRIGLMTGMMMSCASDVTTLPTAPPTITAIASASTLFFS